MSVTYFIGLWREYFRGPCNFFKNFPIPIPFPASGSLQPYFCKHLILVVLIYAQIALRDLIGGMIVYIHQKGRLGALFPCMVAKGLSQRMTADIGVKSCECGGILDDPVGLIAA